MTDEATAPRRLRAQDVIDAQQRTIEQLTTRSNEPYVTVEFTRNAKGETQITTKISASGRASAQDLDLLAAAVYDQAVETYGTACMKFPTGTGFARNEGQEPPK
jgi:spore germination cell wall hydrolase CwlJ-like protein